MRTLKFDLDIGSSGYCYTIIFLGGGEVYIKKLKIICSNAWTCTKCKTFRYSM